MRLPLCVRLPEEDKISARALKADGWREVEILEIYRGDIKKRACRYVREATEKDLPACVEIAGGSFPHDRLHVDTTVAKADADEFKRQIAKDVFHLHEVRVYERDGIRGFMAVDKGRVSLICVKPESQGMGVGKSLIQSWGGDLIAGTQETNAPARNLYKSVGMVRTRALRTFHKWPSTS